MDRHLRERLERALGGSGFDDAELSKYRDVVNSLSADAAGLPGPVSSDFGRAQMLSSLRSQAAIDGGVRRMIFSQPLVIKVAGAMAGTALVFVGMAGASAATGGPDVADTVFDAAGIGDSDDDVNDDADEDVNDDADEDVNDDAGDADEDADDADDDADVEDDADEADDDADDADEIDEADESAEDSASETDDSSDDAADDSSDDDVEDGGTDGS